MDVLKQIRSSLRILSFVVQYLRFQWGQDRGLIHAVTSRD